MVINAEGSLTTAKGSVRHFGRRAFVKLAGDLHRCFVCGRRKSKAVVFDDEHVVPDWILRRFKLHSHRITLPNQRRIAYGQYKLRCCQRCNRLLGKKIEDPMSRLFVDDVMRSERDLFAHRTLLYQWLCLLFIKMHLKDREIRIHPDLRKKFGNIGRIYDWDGLHHIHSVARAAQSRAYVTSGVRGTMMAFPMRPSKEPFDIGTLSDYSTIVVRIGSIGIVCVLNDCGYVGPMVKQYLSRISGPLSAVQFREVAARVAYGNALLKSRPQFWSELKPNRQLTIRAAPPFSVQIGKMNRKSFGKVMAFSCGPLLLHSPTPNAAELFQGLQKGKIQFLYHDDGTFISDSEQEIESA